jgi:hypothetical protein
MKKFYWALIAVSVVTSVVVLILGVRTATLEWIVAPFALASLTIVFYRSIAVSAKQQ